MMIEPYFFYCGLKILTTVYLNFLKRWENMNLNPVSQSEIVECDICA